jgi:hypothetical protein
MRGLLGVLIVAMRHKDLPGYTYCRGLKERRIFAIVFFEFVHHSRVDVARYNEIAVIAMFIVTIFTCDEHRRMT